MRHHVGPATIALDSQQETPAKLRAAAAQPDLDAMAFVAHSVKGAAGNLAAPDVQALAARAEIAARKNDPQAPALAIELADQMHALLAELAARVREQGGP